MAETNEKVEEKDFNFIRGETNVKKRKIMLFVLAVMAFIVTAVMIFVPFCNFSMRVTNDEGTSTVAKSLTAFNVFNSLSDSYMLRSGLAYVSVGLFAVWVLFIALSVAFFIKAIFSFIVSNEKSLYANVKKLLILAVILTCLFFLGGVILSAISMALNGSARSAKNVVPFVISLVLVLLFAIYTGLTHPDFLSDETRKKVRPVAKKLILYKLEFFMFAFVLAGLAVCTFLTNIATIKYSYSSTFLSSASTEIKISGIDILKNFATQSDGGQMLAFALFAFLLVLISLIFLSTVAFLAKSKTFYRLTLISAIASVVSCLLIGIFGKYFEISQKINEEIILAWLNNEGINVTTTGISYKVTSASIYYFFGALIVSATLIICHPYSRALNAQRLCDEEIKTVQGDIAITDLPDDAITSGGTGSGPDGQIKILYADPCPAFTELDAKSEQFNAELETRKQALFSEPTLPKLVQFIVAYARDSRLHLSYTEEDIATFIAGLGTTRLSILQGMSGTGKTSLPKIFTEALYSVCDIVEVESSWRDKSELIGYYNEFSKTFTPKKFTQALYRARLNPETITLIVLDEMNLSRIEYYFSDFLSLMENEPDKRELKLTNVGLFRIENGEKIPYIGLIDGHTLKIPHNVWFIGTANRDESTFEISDKVYDRAHTMNFNKRAPKVTLYNKPLDQSFMPASSLLELFGDAKTKFNFNVEEYPLIAEVEKLLAPYNISFGNRIAMQIESFVSIYCSCFEASQSLVQSAVETILLSKVVSKLELKNVENKELLATEFERLNLHRCSEFISKLHED